MLLQARAMNMTCLTLELHNKIIQATNHNHKIRRKGEKWSLLHSNKDIQIHFWGMKSLFDVRITGEDVMNMYSGAYDPNELAELISEHFIEEHGTGDPRQ